MWEQGASHSVHFMFLFYALSCFHFSSEFQLKRNSKILWDFHLCVGKKVNRKDLDVAVCTTISRRASADILSINMYKLVIKCRKSEGTVLTMAHYPHVLLCTSFKLKKKTYKRAVENSLGSTYLKGSCQHFQRFHLRTNKINSNLKHSEF